MFFSLSKFKNNDFPNHIKWGNIYVGYDNGWTLEENKLTKGYKDKGCIIEYNGSIVLTSFGRQTFPIFINEEKFVVSNLYQQNDFFIGSVTITNDKIIKQHSEDVIFEHVGKTDDFIINKINEIIEQSIISFATDKPFKIFLTGGVDTALVASYVLKNKLPYELITAEHMDMDYFLSFNRRKLKKFWAYNAMHYWRDPSILLSGANGDEMLLRNPVDAFNIMRWYRDDLVEELTNSNYYHSEHFLKDKNLVEYSKQKKFTTRNDLFQYVYKRNSCDFQHWHLGNTTTFCPLDNLELNRLMLCLSYKKMKTQLLDAGVTKQLIEMNYPSLLRYVSVSKNSNNYDALANLYEGKDTL